MQSEASFEEAPPRRRMMVVEDDPRLRRAFAWALQDDFDVVQISSVEEAVTALSVDADVELVLCDLMLDGQMGSELFERLTELHDPRAQRFVLMTAHDPARMRLPSVPVLLKPFTVAVLRQTLATAFL
jgi:two-component system, NtrC family, sensor kinase